MTANEIEDTRPHIGENHPGALAVHSLNDASQILVGVRAQISAQAVVHDDDIARVAELMADASIHIGALFELHGHTERALEEVRLSEVRLSLDNARLIEELNSERRLRHKMEEVDARHVRQINAVRDIVKPRELTAHGYEKPFAVTETAPTALRAL